MDCSTKIISIALKRKLKPERRGRKLEMGFGSDSDHIKSSKEKATLILSQCTQSKPSTNNAGIFIFLHDLVRPQAVHCRAKQNKKSDHTKSKHTCFCTCNMPPHQKQLFFLLLDTQPTPQRKDQGNLTAKHHDLVSISTLATQLSDSVGGLQLGNIKVNDSFKRYQPNS